MPSRGCARVWRRSPHSVRCRRRAQCFVCSLEFTSLLLVKNYYSRHSSLGCGRLENEKKPRCGRLTSGLSFCLTLTRDKKGDRRWKPTSEKT